jgi:predicted extracellular nuclease
MAGRTILGLVAASCALAADHPVAPTIAAVNGINYLSPLRGQNVTGIRGLVTAKGPQGFWIRSEVPDEDDRSSESIYVFGPSALAGAAVGDVITINGRVTEFRSSSAYLYLTQIDQPSNITVVSSGNEVVPLTIGAGGAWNPPTEQYSSLDQGDVFAVPNNRSLISVTNPTLEPRKYGLDFWESLTGELVTVPFPRALGKPNSFGDTWVVGDWPTTGSNGRGGLTITDRDANPEAIIIGSPLDGTSNPTTTRLGDSLQNITGVVTQAFGFYRILPLTTIEVTASRSPALPPPTGLTSNGLCSGLTVGQYNVENLNPQSDHLAAIAAHIVTDLHTPDLLFLQEIQDDTGPTDDAVVTSNATLTALRHAIQALRPSAPAYASVDVPPVDDRDGGQPGANIRVAYLYNPAAVRLVDVRPGNATQATDVLLPGPRLRYNPGLVDPASTAWEASRKPLAAHWVCMVPVPPHLRVMERRWR